MLVMALLVHFVKWSCSHRWLQGFATNPWCCVLWTVDVLEVFAEERVTYDCNWLWRKECFAQGDERASSLIM